MEVSGQPNAPAALGPEKKSSSHWIGSWVGHRLGMDVLENRKSARTGIRTSDEPVSILVAILTAVPR